MTWYVPKWFVRGADVGIYGFPGRRQAFVESLSDKQRFGRVFWDLGDPVLEGPDAAAMEVALRGAGVRAVTHWYEDGGGSR